MDDNDKGIATNVTPRKITITDKNGKPLTEKEILDKEYGPGKYKVLDFYGNDITDTLQ